MNIYRVRNKQTGEFWSDAYQLNRRVKRIYYEVGRARAALSSYLRMHGELDTAGDYEIVEYTLVEQGTYPHAKKSNTEKYGVDNKE